MNDVSAERLCLVLERIAKAQEQQLIETVALSTAFQNMMAVKSAQEKAEERRAEERAYAALREGEPETSVEFPVEPTT
jgi:hypothetical protein